MPVRLELPSIETWAAGFHSDTAREYHIESMPLAMRPFGRWVARQPKVARGRLVYLAREHLALYYLTHDRARQRADQRQGVARSIAEPRDRLSVLRNRWARWRRLRAFMTTTLERAGLPRDRADRAAAVGMKELGFDGRSIEEEDFPEKPAGGRPRSVPPKAVELRDDLNRVLCSNRHPKLSALCKFAWVELAPAECQKVQKMLDNERYSAWTIATHLAALRYRIKPSSLRVL